MGLLKIKEFLDSLGWLNEYTAFETSPFGKCGGIKLTVPQRVMAIYDLEPLPYVEFWTDKGDKEVLGYLTEDEFIAFLRLALLFKKEGIGVYE